MAHGVPKPVLGVTMEQMRDKDRGVAADSGVDRGVLVFKPGCRLRGVTMERTRGVDPGGVRIEKQRGVEFTAGDPRGVSATCGLNRSRPSPGNFGLTLPLQRPVESSRISCSCGVSGGVGKKDSEGEESCDDVGDESPEPAGTRPATGELLSAARTVATSSGDPRITPSPISASTVESLLSLHTPLEIRLSANGSAEGAKFAAAS